MAGEELGLGPRRGEETLTAPAWSSPCLAVGGGRPRGRRGAGVGPQRGEETLTAPAWCSPCLAVGCGRLHGRRGAGVGAPAGRGNIDGAGLVFAVSGRRLRAAAW